jgi:multiple sugar transport system permease protein
MIVNIGMLEQFGNTIIYVLGCSFISAAIPCLMAYLNTKFDYRLNNLIFNIVLVTMMLPIVGSFPSEIRVLKTLGIFDSILGMWIRCGTFLGLYFFVFRATFKGISREFSEAAYVDGGSEWMVMTRIMFPLVRITFFTVMLIKSIEYWNDYEIPRLFLPSYPTLAYGIFELSFTADNEFNNVPMRMASCYTLMIPVFILFMLFRNKLMGNLSMGGIKE